MVKWQVLDQINIDRFVFSMIAYGYILRELQNEGSGLKVAEAAQFEKIKQLILVGWIIYPLGYLAPVVSSDLADLRETLYTIVDIINKVGLGVLVLEWQESSLRKSLIFL